MKILYHHRIASKDGQYVHISELTKALKNIGHEIIMIGPSLVSNEQFGSEGGVVKMFKQHIPKFIYELLELGYAFYAFIKLAKTILKYKPDVIYERYNLYMPAGIWAKKIFGLPLLLEVNAPLYDERSKYDGIALHRLAHLTESYTWTNSDHVLPVTQVLANRILAEGVLEKNITVIPNGVDPGKFSNQLSNTEAKQRLGLEGKLVLGFTGFVREWHGLEDVVELLTNQESGDRFLLLVGDGPAKDAIIDRAKQLKVLDKLKITGVVGRDEVSDYVAAFDIALQPDVVDYASPLKLFEYIALGRAIVAPDKENIKEILSNGENAILFEAGNKQSFVSSIEELCSNQMLREKISLAAKNLIQEKKYLWENNAIIVADIFEDILRHSKAVSS